MDMLTCVCMYYPFTHTPFHIPSEFAALDGKHVSQVSKRSCQACNFLSPFIIKITQFNKWKEWKVCFNSYSLGAQENVDMTFTEVALTAEWKTIQDSLLPSSTCPILLSFQQHRCMSQTLHLHGTQTLAKPSSREIVQSGVLDLRSHGAGVLHGDL